MNAMGGEKIKKKKKVFYLKNSSLNEEIILYASAPTEDIPKGTMSPPKQRPPQPQPQPPAGDVLKKKCKKYPENGRSRLCLDKYKKEMMKIKRKWPGDL